MLKRCIIISCFIAASCRSDSQDRISIQSTPRDTSITVQNAFTLLKIDSQTVLQYIDNARLSDTSRILIRNFYNSRNYQYAWFDETGITEHAGMLWNLYREYTNYAITAPTVDTVLKQNMDQWLGDTDFEIPPQTVMKTEMELTRLFFDYAFAKYIGNINPVDMQWNIPRRKINVSAILDTLVSGNINQVQDWEPLNNQYSLLKNKVLALKVIEEKGGWISLLMDSKKKLKEGDKDRLITLIKKRMQISGQFPANDSSNVFTNELKDSVMVMQRQFNLNPDGMIGPSLIDELNVPVNKRIQQILINMERMRWVPRQPAGTWILVNIPSFHLSVYQGGSSVMQMNIVVGKAASKTVIFSDELKYIVFSPYWNVPPSIVRNEILPAMKKNRNYLKRSNMEQTGTSNGLPVIRQLPGPGNALGQVKFIFPNNYNIYLHDTPAKSYFNETNRAFSHGCVRVNKPFELAEFLLQNDTSWNNKKIRSAMNGKKEKWVTLQEQVPVFITYFTAWVGNDGRVQFRKDIYNHDKQMANHLFVNKRN